MSDTHTNPTPREVPSHIAEDRRKRVTAATAMLLANVFDEEETGNLGAGALEFAADEFMMLADHFNNGEQHGVFASSILARRLRFLERLTRTASILARHQRPAKAV